MVEYLRTEWSSMFTFAAKGKFELIKESKIDEKVRTFYAASSVANLLLMFFIQPFANVYQIRSA